MTTNPKVFKTYDLRGVYKEDFDEDLAYRLGLAFCRLRRTELGRDNLSVVAAHDMRQSSPELHQALIRGLMDGGAQVFDIGLASTPTFYFAVAHYGYDGGIQVSASHNPKEWNGFKLVRERALPIGEDTGLKDIKALVFAETLSPVSERGILEVKEGVVGDQVAHDLGYADVAKLKPMKIVVDPANGMGAQYFEELFIHLPGEVIKMNWELDGSFPGHPADPFKPENIAPLCQKVLEQKADFGIATDGDADRIFFVDNAGRAVEPGIVRAVLSKIFLTERPGSKIAYDIRPGKITPDTIIAQGGVPVITRVGHSLIKAQAVKEGCFFAGESSGHFFLNMPEGCYEVPMIAALKIWADLCESGLTMAEYIKPYQKYFNSGEINFQVEDPAKVLVEIKRRYADGHISELDGVSVEYPDFWFNVRGSHTEPLVRLNLEATSQEIMASKRDEISGLIK